MPSNYFPITEATSALTFSTLTQMVAFKLGVASYGSTGTGPPQWPSDSRNLAICQGIVNDSIRMLIADAPYGSWKWQKPVVQVDLWPPIAPDMSIPGTPPTGSTYVQLTGYSSTTSTMIVNLITPNPGPSTTSSYPVTYLPNFAPTFEYCTMWLGGVPSTGTLGWFQTPQQNQPNTSTIGVPLTVYQFLGPYAMSVYVGSASTQAQVLSTNPYSTTANIPFSFSQTGEYTMPANFSGEAAGDISYIYATNRGMILTWTSEALIRQFNQNQNIQLGPPQWAALRLFPEYDYQNMSFTPPRRRWQLLTWRITAEFLSVLFPYQLAFNNLVNPTDLPPCPISFDDTLMAACRAQAERYVTDSINGCDWQYYRTVALPNAIKIDQRSNEQALGYCGSGKRSYWGMNLTNWREWLYLRPPIGSPNPPSPGTGSY